MLIRHAFRATNLAHAANMKLLKQRINIMSNLVWSIPMDSKAVKFNALQLIKPYMRAASGDHSRPHALWLIISGLYEATKEIYQNC